jgi:hypothetical protein
MISYLPDRTDQGGGTLGLLGLEVTSWGILQGDSWSKSTEMLRQQKRMILLDFYPAIRVCLVIFTIYSWFKCVISFRDQKSCERSGIWTIHDIL